MPLTWGSRCSSRTSAVTWPRTGTAVGCTYLTTCSRAPAAHLRGELGHSLPPGAVAAIAWVVRELLAVADRYYRSGDRGLYALPWRAALAVRIARSVYAAIGRRIERVGCDVTAGRAV